MGSLIKQLITIIITLFLVLSIHSVASDDPNRILSNFIQCLPNAIFSTTLTEKNSSFETRLQNRIWNAIYTKAGTPKPLALIEAKNEPHIRYTIICAKKHGLQIRVRSGGHDFESISSVSKAPFVILDMINFHSIEIETNGEESAWVGAGATMGELYYNIGEKSKVLGFPAAIGPPVGAGGHISGGGYGNMMRKYGLSSDNVIDAKIMDSNGIVRDRKHMGEDVFWALRGGGGGSFGVILSFKVKLVKVPELVTVFHVKRSREQGGSEAMYRWQYVAPSFPNELFIRALIGVSNGTIDIGFIGLFLGQSNELISLVEKEFPELGLKAEECHEMSWVDSTVFWDNRPIGSPREVLLNRLNGSTFSIKVKSDYVQKPIPREELELIWETMVKLGETVSMKWNPYGGRMSEISESESPFPHRAGNIFLIQYTAVWTEKGDEFQIKNSNSLKELYDKMTPFVSENPREAFFNYRDYSLGLNLDNQTDYEIAVLYGRKYFKGNFERLAIAKNIIDPQNFFKNGQSIPPLPKERQSRNSP